MNRREAGARFESIAADYLIEQGYQILQRNYRFGRNEIDLICLDGECLVFVEVKGSVGGSFGDPVYKVDQRKQESLTAAAQGFLQGAVRTFDGVRFDVVTVTEDKDGQHRIDHRVNAFTL
jgi:putative endonuclease